MALGSRSLKRAARLPVIRLRASAAERFKRTENAMAILWKLLLVAQSTFRWLDAPNLLPSVAAGDLYVNGSKTKKSRTNA